jgi:hypothetical protein
MYGACAVTKVIRNNLEITYTYQNVRSWVRQFTEGRTSCENKPKEPPPRTSRSEDVIARVERKVKEDRRILRPYVLCLSCFSTGHSVVMDKHTDINGGVNHNSMI